MKTGIMRNYWTSQEGRQSAELKIDESREEKERSEASEALNVIWLLETKRRVQDYKHWQKNGHDQCWCLRKEACGKKKNEK